MPRFYCPMPLAAGQVLDLPPGAARHVQVLRMQPGHSLELFNHGPGWDWGQQAAPPSGQFSAEITAMGRSQVQVRVLAHQAQEREAARAVYMAVAMPANERMDWLVEKATELGVAAIFPLISARSVLRLAGERADKKVAHWQAVAIAACEQCGGNRVPLVHPVQSLEAFLAAGLQAGFAHAPAAPQAMVLSLREGAGALRAWPGMAGTQPVLVVSGPEGGLTEAEEALALAAHCQPVSLGPRVLRAETAALAALALLL